MFDTLVKGFDNHVTIHNCCTATSDKEIAIPMLYATLLWCEDGNDEIDDEAIDDALEYIHEHANLTTNCKCEWVKRTLAAARDYGSGKFKFNNCGYLFNAIKYHNPDYYKSNVIPLLRQSIQETNESFKSSSYTINQFNRDVSTFKTIAQLINKIKLCVAINTNGGYIVKQLDNDESGNEIKNIVFNVIGKNELLNIINADTFSYDATEEDKQKMRDAHKKVTDRISIKISKLVTDSQYLDNFDKYDGVALLTNCNTVLQIYNPPATTTYDKQLIVDWITFMKSLLNNPIAFDELLYSHAYRFKHPSEFIEKFFINYGKGHNGKSYLAACFESIYPHLANVAATQTQIESDTFNAWIVNNLFVWLEEAEQ